MWSRNTVRESSYISFFCGGEPLCVLERRPENTQDMFAWVTSRSLPSLEGPADLYLQSNFTDLFKFHAEVWTFSPHLFFCLWLVIGTYILPFFLVICWSYLRTEISVTLSIGNILFPVKPLCWFYLATALNLLSSSSPAKIVYYTYGVILCNY